MTDHKYAHHIYPILLCALFTWLGCWGVLKAGKAYGDQKVNEAVTNDLNWAEAIKTSEACIGPQCVRCDFRSGGHSYVFPEVLKELDCVNLKAGELKEQLNKESR